MNVARRLVASRRVIAASYDAKTHGLSALSSQTVALRLRYRRLGEEWFLPRRSTAANGTLDESALRPARRGNSVRKLKEQLAESIEQQQATSAILRVIASSRTDAQLVFDMIAASAARLCDAQLSHVFRFGGNLLYFAASNGLSSEGLEVVRGAWPRRPDRGSAAGRAILSGAIEQIPDVQEDAEYALGSVATVARFRSTMGVPILLAGTPVGVITVSRSQPGLFPDNQVELLKTFADQAVIAIENTRLFEEVQARTAELSVALEYQTATSDVLSVISRSPSEIQPVLDTIVETAAQLCDANRAFIYRRDGAVLRHQASHNASSELMEFVTRNPISPGRHSGVGRAALEKRTIHISDVRTDPEYSFGGAHVDPIRTVLAVPMLKAGDLVGVLVIYRLEVRPFTDKQIELVTTFADQAVIAINNVRLFEEVQARTRELARSVEELRALGDVSHAVNSTLDLETVLDTIVAKAVQLSATDAGAIYVFSKLRQQFRLRATYGMTEAMIAEIGRQSVGLGAPYIGTATNSGEAIQVSDLATEPPSPIRDLVLSAGYRALLVVPLLRPGRVVGALVVRRKEPGVFPSSTIDLLQTFAAQSVLAIQNARLFEDVEARTRELAKSLEELRAAQERLIQTEKLASLGQLTAGIAHEIKNPLNFVNNFAALSIELIDELKEAIGSARQNEEQTAELMGLLAGNLDKVVQHGKRADSIVKNMLLHSRAGSGERRVADINALLEESLNLAYHGARAEKQDFNITIEQSLDPSAGELELLPQEITRVFLNLISNGFYATVKRKEPASAAYEPILFAATRNLGDKVEIRIRDNGTGVSPEVKDKMFNPFFTTKPAGEGTGLGLSLSYDIIVKQHAGTIEVETEPGVFTEFRIVLPRTGSPA
jgi:two-component system NtrC family sensor kinase